MVKSEIRTGVFFFNNSQALTLEMRKSDREIA